jgi:type II secretory pathway pseudopilin PulG
MVLITTAIMAIVTTSFISIYSSQTKANRNLAAQSAVIDLSHALDVLLGAANCQTTGSSNFKLGSTSPVTVSLITGPPSSYALNLNTLNFSNGTLAFTSTPNEVIANMIRPYQVSALTLIPLGGEGAIATGFQYPFKMEISFSNPKGGPAPLPLTKYAVFYTDSTRKVVGACNSGTNTYFGGVYQTSNLGCNKINPVTGSVSCPSGFTDTVVYGAMGLNVCTGTNDQTWLHLCLR